MMQRRLERQGAAASRQVQGSRYKVQEVLRETRSGEWVQDAKYFVSYAAQRGVAEQKYLVP